jgi:hypothetical protein
LSTFSDALGTIVSTMHRAEGSPEILYDDGVSPFEIVAVFDSAGALVDVGGVLQRTTEPQLGVVLADFTTAPKAGDSVTVDSVAYDVFDVEPDGQGGATLRLRKA